MQVLQVFHAISMDPTEVHEMKLCNSEAFTITAGASSQLERPVSPQNTKAQPKKAGTARVNRRVLSDASDVAIARNVDTFSARSNSCESR